MKITLLAKTELKQSYQDDKIFWFKEYATGEFESESEKEEYYKKYNMRDVLEFQNPCISLRRRVDIISNVNNPHEWDILTCEKDIHTAALNIGDSDYYKAESLNIVHTQVLDYCNKYNELQKELTELEDCIIPHKFSPRSKLSQKYNDLYESELKDRRLFSKAKTNSIPDDIFKSISEPLQAQYKDELGRINNRIMEVKEELKNLSIEKS
jgi:hypothetical protein